MLLDLTLKDNILKYSYNEENNVYFEKELEKGIVEDGIIIKEKILLKQIKNIINKDLKKLKFSSLNLNIVSSTLDYFILDIPAINKPKEIKQLIKLEVELKDKYYSYFIYGKKIFLITIPKIIINNYLYTFNKLNLKINKITHNLFKIINYFSNTENNILYICKYKSFILNFKEELKFLRKIDIGNIDFKKHLNIEKIITEVYRSLDYYQMNFKKELKNVILISENSNKIITPLSKRLGLEVLTKRI